MKEKLTILKSGILRYSYQTSKDCGFSFPTLAEVGAPYQPYFREEIARRGLKVEYGVNIDAAPWVVDRLLPQ